MNFLLIYFYFISAAISTDTVTLSISVDNIKSIEGNIEIGIFRKEDTFLGKGDAYKTYTIEVLESTETITIKNLPKGDYAVTMYHDKNSDGICNRNFIGMPKEPYAFSKNFRPKFSAPTFEDCKFSLVEDRTMSISLIH